MKGPSINVKIDHPKELFLILASMRFQTQMSTCVTITAIQNVSLISSPGNGRFQAIATSVAATCLLYVSDTN